MKIAVRKIDQSVEGVWYAPDFEDNRDLPEEHQAAVKIIPVSARRFKEIESSNLMTSRAQKSKDAGAYLARREWALKRKTLEESIVDLRNWKSEDESGQTKELKTPKELLDALEHAEDASMLAILSDVYNAAVSRSALDEGALGN